MEEEPYCHVLHGEHHDVRNARHLAVQRGAQSKSNKPGTPRGVSNKGEGKSQISSNTSEHASTKEISGTVLAIKSEVATRSEGQFS